MKPIDFKRPTVPLWKNLELVIYLISEQETDFQRDPMYLHRAHLVNGPIFFLLSVHVSIISVKEILQIFILSKKKRWLDDKIYSWRASKF